MADGRWHAAGVTVIHAWIFYPSRCMRLNLHLQILKSNSPYNLLKTRRETRCKSFLGIPC